MTNSHTSSWALYDPQVAEYASKLEAVLEPYDNILPDHVQVPYVIGISMVKASEMHAHTATLEYLDKYGTIFNTSASNPHNYKQQWTKAFYINLETFINKGKKRDSWQAFYAWMKMAVEKYNHYDGNFQAAYYNTIDL